MHYNFFLLWTVLFSLCVHTGKRVATDAVLEIRLKFCNCISFAHSFVSSFRCFTDFVFRKSFFLYSLLVRELTHTHGNMQHPFLYCVVCTTFWIFNTFHSMCTTISSQKVKFDVREARDKHFSVDLPSLSGTWSSSTSYIIASFLRSYCIFCNVVSTLLPLLHVLI